MKCVTESQTVMMSFYVVSNHNPQPTDSMGVRNTNLRIPFLGRHVLKIKADEKNYIIVCSMKNFRVSD